MTRSHPVSQSNRRWLSSWFVRVAICAILAGLMTNQASGQEVSLSLGSGTGTPGSIVTLSVSMSATGGAQPSGVQWAMGYSASDITSVVETIGSAASAAGKSIQCSYGSGTATCLVAGFNTTTIGNGTVATFAFTIASGTSSTNVPVTLNGTLV